jgi:hypothetical protein
MSKYMYMTFWAICAVCEESIKLCIREFSGVLISKIAMTTTSLHQFLPQIKTFGHFHYLGVC